MYTNIIEVPALKNTGQNTIDMEKRELLSTHFPHYQAAQITSVS